MHDETETQIRSLLPTPQSDWFLQARALYLRAQYREAITHDEKLLAWAESHGHPMGRILGHRFVGLCHFRLEALDESAHHLQMALNLAEALPAAEQRFLCANHLAATLRRQGQLLEAHDLLRKYLEQAVLPTYVHERARLYGNYGALLDQFGQRSAADDCYARMEELCELINNADRLANARGLAARSADLRGDETTARQKYEEERQLAAATGNAARQVAATLHRARMTSKLGHYDEAIALCQEGLAQATTVGHPSRLLDAWESMGEIFQRCGRLAAAHKAFQSAMKYLNAGTDHPEKRANLSRSLSTLSCTVGLHGDALYYLTQSAQIRWQLFAPLRRNERVHKMARSRFEELTKLAQDLVEEASMVARRPEEHESLRDLFCQLLDRHPPNQSADELIALLGRRTREDVLQWQQSQREKAHRLWRERVLPNTFALLSPSSQEDLIRAEMSYSATVGDLPRFAHLLAVVVERELRERIILPSALLLFASEQQRKRWQRATLGEMLDVLNDARTNTAGGHADRELMRRHLSQIISQQPKVIEAVLRLRDKLQRADGRGDGITLVKLRNAVAHGDESALSPQIDRLMVDAVKRALILEDDPPLLAQLTSLRLAPANSGQLP